MKQLMKKHPILLAALLCLLMSMIVAVISTVQGQHYYYRIYSMGGTITDLNIQQLADDGTPIHLVEQSAIETTKDYTIVYFDAVTPGSGWLSVAYTLLMPDGEAQDFAREVMLVVSPLKVIFIGGGTLNHNGAEVIYYGISLYALLMIFYFIWRRRSLGKAGQYSYAYISTWSSQLFFTIVFLVYAITLAASVLWLQEIDVYLLAGVTSYLSLFMTALTFPLVVLFAISMTISNISLIRHEGKRFNNMLGIMIGFGLLFMVAVAAVLFVLFVSYGRENALIAVLYSSFNALYIVFICALGGAIISGLLAGHRKPALGVDYIIILGCAIRKDGSLYPLIRGRVDRAIAFWQAQMQATGKKAVFVPSGGKGSDEIIAEAEAMKRYLLSQGIEEQSIMAETRSTNTYENMAFSKALIEAADPAAKVAFSTTNYHVMRSGILAGQAGLTAEGMGARTKWYFWPNALLREVVGMFAYQPKLQIVTMVILALLAGAAGYAYYWLM